MELVLAVKLSKEWQWFVHHLNVCQSNCQLHSLVAVLKRRLTGLLAFARSSRYTSVFRKSRSLFFLGFNGHCFSENSLPTRLNSLDYWIVCFSYSIYDKPSWCGLSISLYWNLAGGVNIFLKRDSAANSEPSPWPHNTLRTTFIVFLFPLFLDFRFRWKKSS